MRKLLVLAASATAVVAIELAACGNQVGDSAGGAEVFAKMCAACHGPTGKPEAAMVARLGVHDLTAPDFRTKVTPALVEHQVREGSQNKLMPSFTGAITDEQIRAVAAYVAGAGFVKGS
jgi:mono/diheme cytochrome c family protein